MLKRFHTEQQTGGKPRDAREVLSRNGVRTLMFPWLLVTDPRISDFLGLELEAGIIPFPFSCYQHEVDGPIRDMYFCRNCGTQAAICVPSVCNARCSVTQAETGMFINRMYCGTTRNSLIRSSC